MYKIKIMLKTQNSNFYSSLCAKNENKTEVIVLSHLLLKLIQCWLIFKDFWEMFAHHVATMLLLWFSWSGNFVRVGTLVLVIHDAADYLMEVSMCHVMCHVTWRRLVQVHFLYMYTSEYHLDEFT